jgi:hypothetical protein
MFSWLSKLGNVYAIDPNYLNFCFIQIFKLGIPLQMNVFQLAVAIVVLMLLTKAKMVWLFFAMKRSSYNERNSIPKTLNGIVG